VRHFKKQASRQVVCKKVILNNALACVMRFRIFMKTKLLSLALTVSAFTMFNVRGADHDLEKFQQQALQLNTFCAGHPRISAELSKLLKIDPAMVQKAIENEKCKVSGVVAAQLIAQKTRKTPVEVLACTETINWPAEFRKNGIPLSDVVEYLENLNTELACTALATRSPKIRK